MSKKKERRSIEHVYDLHEQEVARKLEQVVLDYIAERKLSKRLPDKTRQTYIDRLKAITGHGSPSMLSKMVNGYQSYAKENPDKPAVNFFLHNRGRPRKDVVTQEQANFIKAAYMRRKRSARLSTGKEKKINSQPDLEEVNNLVKATYPDYDQNVDWLRRFLKEAEKQAPLFFEVARADDVDQVYTKRLGKKVNAAPEDQEWWQSDGRTLPTPVRREDFACKVQIVTVMDHKSGFVPAYRLVPTKRRDSQGKVINVAFTEYDVRLAFALAVIECRHIPHIWYRDKGSQYEKFDLSMLFNDQNNMTVQIPCRRNSPAGRGKGERMQALIDHIAPRLPGYSEDSNRPFPRRLTQKMIKELCSLEEYIIEIDKAVTDWNNQPVGGYESRRAMWEASNKVFLPQPSPMQLGLFIGFNKYEDDVLLQNDGVHREKTVWQNIWESKEAYVRFSNATTTKIVFCTMMINDTLRAFGVLDPAYGMEEFIPKEANAAISNSRYKSYQDHVRSSMSQKQRDLLDGFKNILTDRFGELPSVGVHDRQPYLKAGRVDEVVSSERTHADHQNEVNTIDGTAPSVVVDNHQPPAVPSSPAPKKANFAERLRQLRAEQGNDQ